MYMYIHSKIQYVCAHVYVIIIVQCTHDLHMCIHVHVIIIILWSPGL